MTKANVLKDTYGPLYSKIEFVQADLNDAKSLSLAVKDCTHIIHVASPVGGDPTIKKDEQMIEWAVNGTKTILDACEKNNVEKLVVTSSSATIAGCLWKTDKTKSYNEEDFSFGK
jgi:dihydroflavonol-4-reductase